MSDRELFRKRCGIFHEARCALVAARRGVYQRAIDLASIDSSWQIAGESLHQKPFHLTNMRNFLVGLFLGAALAAGIGVSATGAKGPQLTGQSGPLKYAVVVENEIACIEPWVSLKERTIECYADSENGPDQVTSPMRNVAE